jgi:tRNA threonylcarbamoyladenosine biosynthesis protein TsaE
MEPMRRFVTLTRSPAETEYLGREMAARIDRGACIVLAGRLGSGKTVFIRGACRGLGVNEDILSPTFILYEAFEGRLPVVHVDLYRLHHEAEIEQLGVFDLLGDDTVILAEWGDRSPRLMENADIVVTIATAEGPDHRRVTISWSHPFDETFAEARSWSS